MASSVRSRTISASIPGTGGGPDGSADVLADDVPADGDEVEPQAAVSSTTSAIAVRRMAGSLGLPGGSAVSLGHPCHDPAGLHAHVELLLGIGRGTAARLPGVQVERGAVPG